MRGGAVGPWFWCRESLGGCAYRSFFFMLSVISSRLVCRSFFLPSYPAIFFVCCPPVFFFSHRRYSILSLSLLLLCVTLSACIWSCRWRFIWRPERLLGFGAESESGPRSRFWLTAYTTIWATSLTHPSVGSSVIYTWSA